MASAPLASALYVGTVMHARRRPRVHRFVYKIYTLLLDIDELDAVDARLRWFSVDRFNLFSFHRKDRGDGTGLDMRGQVERNMIAAGIVPDGGPIRLLTMPRLLGWSFNPLSVFFCYTRAGEVSAILWQVDNTFGERHSYMIGTMASAEGEISQDCAKRLYVSPFMDMDLDYAFKVRPPGATLSISIDVSDPAGSMLIASHIARRVELTDAALLKAFFTIPFLTLRVVGGIHWEALKLWLMGIKLRTRPTPPDQPVSITGLSGCNRELSKT